MSNLECEVISDVSDHRLNQLVDCFNKLVNGLKPIDENSIQKSNRTNIRYFNSLLTNRCTFSEECVENLINQFNTNILTFCHYECKNDNSVILPKQLKKDLISYLTSNNQTLCYNTTEHHSVNQKPNLTISDYFSLTTILCPDLTLRLTSTDSKGNKNYNFAIVPAINLNTLAIWVKLQYNLLAQNTELSHEEICKQLRLKNYNSNDLLKIGLITDNLANALFNVSAQNFDNKTSVVNAQIILQNTFNLLIFYSNFTPRRNKSLKTMISKTFQSDESLDSKINVLNLLTQNNAKSIERLRKTLSPQEINKFNKMFNCKINFEEIDEQLKTDYSIPTIERFKNSLEKSTGVKIQYSDLIKIRAIKNVQKQLIKERMAIFDFQVESTISEIKDSCALPKTQQPSAFKRMH